MNITQLGKLERIDDLRQVWPHEARDFTKWLAQEENLDLLSRAIEIDLVTEETESAVGDYKVDIFAVESSGNQRRIVIENQLEETNHDHLGKIITYASGKGAEVVIWVVKKARQEHKRAIEWLNQISQENIGFFLLEIELWRIGDSLIAPKFNLVEGPNDWAKQVRSTENLSELKLKQLNYWEAFVAYAFKKPEFAKVFSQRKVYPQHWYSMSAGSSDYHISLEVNTPKKRIATTIYISNNKELYEKLKLQEAKIQEITGCSLEWIVATKDCRILAVNPGNPLGNEDAWTTAFDWYCDMALKMRKILDMYV